MAKLARAALSSGMGREYAKRGWDISTTGAAPAGNGAYERMGGLDGLEAMKDAKLAGVDPGQPSGWTNPFRGLPGVESQFDAQYADEQTGGQKQSYYQPQPVTRTAGPKFSFDPFKIRSLRSYLSSQ